MPNNEPIPILFDEVEITTNGDSPSTFTGSFSSIFSHIFYDNGNQILNYSLKDFFNTIQNFFTAPMHMIYQIEEPKDFSIKEWYKIVES